MPTVLRLLGTAMQLTGAAVTAWGAKLIWRDLAARDDTLVGPAVVATHRLLSRYMIKLRQMFRKPQRKTVHGSMSAVAPLPTAKLRGHTNFRQLPQDVASAEAISELDDRTREIMERLGQLTNKLADEIETHQAENTTIAKNLRAALDDRAERERRRAITGIRYEAVGLFLLALGSTLNALGALMPRE